MEYQLVKKPKILCLHGYGYSAAAFEKQVKIWPAYVLEKMDLVFIDAPFPVEREDDTPSFKWFEANKDFTGYTNFDEGIAYIEDCMVKLGPFDGVLGFSQGALITAALPGMQARGVALTKVVYMKFVMVIAGGKFSAPKLAANAFSSPIEIPSLHCFGEKDDFAKLPAIELLGSFVDPFVIYHPGGHIVPKLDSMDNVRDVLGRWGKKVGEATKKAEDLAGNTWQHLKTAPSLADAALGRIAQGTKVLAEGGYEKIFQQTFDTVPEEQLQNSFACYLSTSAGPVMGVLYASTAKLAFCSDNPLSYKADDNTEWSYYKVVIPLHQLKAINSSSSRTNSAEKYIQIISVDNHEFWYMGFLNYDGAVKCLEEALQARNLHSV